MTTETKTFLRTTSIHIPSTNADRTKTYQARALITRFRATNIVRSNLAFIKTENLHPASIVTARPLPIYPARFVYTESERRRALARTTKMLAPKYSFVAHILQPNHQSTCRNNKQLFVQSEVPRTAKLILPRCPSPVFEPILTAPTVGIKTQDLLYKIPGPTESSIRFQTVYPGSECSKINALPARNGSAEYRITTAYLFYQFPARRIEDVIGAGRRSEMKIISHNQRRRDIIAVGPAAAGLVFPHRAKGTPVNTHSHTRTIHDVYTITMHNRRRKYSIRQGHGGEQLQRRLYRPVRHVTGMSGIVFELLPVLTARCGAYQP
jgi:hypothetical protein